MFGNIGVPDRLAFSAIGAPVNAAQRLEAATKKRGLPVLATSPVGEVAAVDWVPAGRYRLCELHQEVQLFTLGDAEARGATRASD